MGNKSVNQKGKNEITALVPMKGHSERVKNKNLRSFNGIPLFYWVLESLSRSPFISKICVDTDSEEIEKTVLSFFPDVLILDRPKELIGDFISMNEIIRYDISKLEGDIFIQTHATNPLLSSGTINNACEFYLKNRDRFDSVFSVNRLQTRLYDKQGKPLNHDPDKLIRTQDLDPLFEENSNLYLFSKDSFREAGARIGLRPGMFEMTPTESFDIDTEEDFLMAELMQKIKQGK